HLFGDLVHVPSHMERNEQEPDFFLRREFGCVARTRVRAKIEVGMDLRPLRLFLGKRGQALRSQQQNRSQSEVELFHGWSHHKNFKPNCIIRGERATNSAPKSGESAKFCMEGGATKLE